MNRQCWIVPAIAALLLIGCGSGSGDAPLNETPRLALDAGWSAGAGPRDVALNADHNGANVSWTGLTPGDYNFDGAVDGLDLFPLASNFGAQSSEVEGGECIDGNGDGVLSGQDLFLIAGNFLTRVTGWFVYDDETADGLFDSQPLNKFPLAYGGCEVTYHGVSPFNPGRYYFAVRGVDEASGETGELSNVADLDVEPPAPGELTVSSGDATVEISWYAGSLDLTQGWYVFRSAEPDGPWTRLNALPLTRFSDFYADYPLTRDQPWFYKVVGENVYGTQSEESAVVSGRARGGRVYSEIDAELGGISTFFDISIADTGETAVSYYDDENLVLKAAVLTGGVWQTETVDSDGDVGKYNSIAHDLEGNPFIGYLDESSDLIKVAWHDGDNWQLKTVAEGRGWLDTAVDPDGNPAVLLNGDDSLMLAWYHEPKWPLYTLDESAGRGYCALTFGDDGMPLVVSQDDGVTVSRYDGSGWQTELIDPGDGNGLSVSLTLDAQGRPVVAYYGLHGEETWLKCARFDGSNWSISPVAERSAGIEFYPTFIGLGADGMPLISAPKRFAWDNGTNWEINLEFLSENPAMALDSGREPLLVTSEYSGLKTIRFE